MGLKGVKPEDLPKVEALIQAKLEELARDGFSAEAVAASLNTIEFNLRENNTGARTRSPRVHPLRSLRSPLEPLCEERSRIRP